MKENIEEMILSSDKECVYLAVSMLRNNPHFFNSKSLKLLKKVSLFERIRNYSDICKELKEEEKQFPFDKIKQIEKLFNGNWKKDWKNSNQYKYFPYFTISGSGALVFGYSGCFGTYFYGVVGFYKDKETSDFVGRTFIDIYKEIM